MAEEVITDAPSDPTPAPVVDTGVKPAAPAAPPSTSPEPKTLVGAATPDPSAPATPSAPAGAADPASVPAWPEGLKERLAGGDEKKAQLLERFKTVDALVDKMVEQEKLIRSGAIKKPLPANATPEQAAEWRKANDVPESPTDYALKLDEGFVLGDADKAVVDAWLTEAHKRNMDNGTASAAVNDYLRIQAQQVQEQMERDVEFQAQSVATLKEAFGGSYTRNLNAVKTLLATAPSGVGDALLEGRTADGAVIGNDPRIIQWLVGLAASVNPQPTLTPAGSTTNVADEISRIEDTRRTNPDAYWNDTAMQKRYGELLAIRG